jgi:hypothetical protein
MKRSLKFFPLLFITLLISVSSFSMPNVNILTWWGYLSAPWEAKIIESTCHVNLSYDQYYATDEFLRRWRQSRQDYDIAIFEDTAYPLIAKEIPHVASNLWRNTNNYNPIIRRRYQARNYPENIVFFYQSVTGFLWNPKAVSLASKDSLVTMFKKAKNNLVVLIDDPIVFQKFQYLGTGKKSLSLREFLKIKQNTKIFITNSYDMLYKKTNFAFSYMWSGAALSDLAHANKSYKFLIDSRASYISSDLLAQLNNKPGVVCVANLLASKKFLTKEQNYTYYFSPYANRSNVEQPFFKEVYEQYINNLSTLHWIKPVDEEKMKRVDRAWKKIKLYLSEKNT